MAIATFGAGCFWGVEQFFKEVEGVKRATCGYMGGESDNPSYQEVKTGNTGHAEVVEVEFDDTIVSFEQLLETFWQFHNPTTVNQQGEDHGSQYRSVVFYHNDAQKQQAQLSKAHQQNFGYWKDKTIVTEIEPVQTFYVAEEYHQGYFDKHDLPSCHIALY
ncbi:peptide-methionine (S)-S-oxide reductase MsrA [Ferrimonas aestuarii]|uniref:Peptide methionine sulfoxide reductase MsrA n=1 Tax=Ferrimonas aestuarii TaxID=2569539 RepID=A0A4U1BW16_9GAMM|nr:peptide-methionine (S)-S-oxide reductase MsrA [Ferrimonas aestuarii]TKB58634.1 peptide-methionine (S)-S-oxide reductase MsrA [Ferrimonas aestuarii]